MSAKSRGQLLKKVGRKLAFAAQAPLPGVVLLDLSPPQGAVCKCRVTPRIRASAAAGTSAFRELGATKTDMAAKIKRALRVWHSIEDFQEVRKQI